MTLKLTTHVCVTTMVRKPLQHLVELVSNLDVISTTVLLHVPITGLRKPFSVLEVLLVDGDASTSTPNAQVQHHQLWLERLPWFRWMEERTQGIHPLRTIPLLLQLGSNRRSWL